MRLILSKKAYRKIKYYATHADGEISGLGRSVFEDKDTIVIKDIDVFEQINTDASTILNENAIAKVLQEKIKNNEPIQEWNVWWHSHYTFSTFWSSTDEYTIENSTGGKYFISLVVNKAMDMKARVDMFSPFRGTFNITACSSRIGRPANITKYLSDYCKKQLKKCLWNQQLENEDWPWIVIDSSDKPESSIQQNDKKLSPSLVREILGL
jgi:proteasome lid subunit RPN8/RPN11